MYFILYWVILVVLELYLKPTTTEDYIFVMAISLASTFIWWMSVTSDRLYGILKQVKKLNDRQEDNK